MSWASATPEKRKVSGHACRWNNRIHKLNCGNLLPLVDNRGFPDSGKVGVLIVIHFSTASLVHNLTATDQHVYPKHPQDYPQDASLAHPGAGVIGARSHAGPGLLCSGSSCPPSLPSRLPSRQPPFAHARLSDEVSDNRHGHRRTPADISGRSAAGHTRCGAGSKRLYLASGRRGRRFKSGHPDSRQGPG
jgi:hypothetical protein